MLESMLEFGYILPAFVTGGCHGGRGGDGRSASSAVGLVGRVGSARDMQDALVRSGSSGASGARGKCGAQRDARRVSPAEKELGVCHRRRDGARCGWRRCARSGPRAGSWL